MNNGDGYITDGKFELMGMHALVECNMLMDMVTITYMTKDYKYIGEDSMSYTEFFSTFTSKPRLDILIERAPKLLKRLNDITIEGTLCKNPK